MTIADKLITIADNTSAVAEAVNGSMTTKNGTVFRIEDIADAPIKIQTEPGAEVTVCGWNLFNKYAPQYSGAYCTSAIVNDELVITTNNGNNYNSANFVIPNGEALVGQTITISGIWETSGVNTGCLRLGWTNKSNKHGMVGSIGGTSQNGTPVTKTIGAKPADADQLCLWVYGNYTGTGEKGSTVTYRNIQLEIGSTATDYENYQVHQTATADESGKVEGIEIVHPTMTIVANKPMECKYFPTSAESVYEKYQQLVQAENDLKAIL